MSPSSFCSVSCSEKVEGLITTFTIRPDKEAYQSVAVSDLVSSVEHMEPAYHFCFDRKIPARLLTRSPEELSLSDRFYYKYWFRKTDGWILLTTIFFPENTACHFFYNKRIQKAYVVTDKNALIDDMGINGLGMNAAPDRQMKTDYDETGFPEIVVAYLK